MPVESIAGTHPRVSAPMSRPDYSQLPAPLARELARNDAAVREANGLDKPDLGLAEERRPVEWPADVVLKRNNARLEQPWRRLSTSSEVKLNRRLRAVIRLVAHGDFDETLATGMSLAAACKVCGYQLRAARRLASNPIFLDALAKAQAEAGAVRAAQKAHASPPAPIAPPAPVIAPPAAPEPPSARQDVERPMIAVHWTDATSEHGRAVVIAPAEPEPALPEPAAVQHGLGAYVDYAGIRMSPSPGFTTRPAARQQPRIIPAAPRRSLRRG